MDKQEDEAQKKQLTRRASLFQAPGSKQTNKRAEERMRNEIATTVWLIAAA
jgi:hypothetical protein